MSLLITVLLLLLCLLLYQLLSARAAIKQLIEAARESRPILIERSPARSSPGLLTRLFEAYNDLVREKADISDTGRKQFEQIRATLANLREAVVMIDDEKRIQLANPAFGRLTGQGTDPVGRRLDLFITGPAFREFLTTIEQDEEGRQAELEASIGNRTCWLEISVAPLPDYLYPNNHYTLFVLHDVSRQKGLEKMRTDFVANVSHELRTPVTVIKGFAETLLEDHEELPPKERIRFLEKIRTHSMRLDDLLNDLLLLSRLESDEMSLKTEKLSLSEFLASHEESWESILRESGGDLVLALSDGKDEIMADPLRLTQIITNLLQNTVLHGKGFTRVCLKTSIGEKTVRLVVEDDGPGIPETDLPRIFQRFYRVEQGRSRDTGGTGLGLAIVKHIVVQHGGEIEARNAEGGGTSIEIRFPLYRAG